MKAAITAITLVAVTSMADEPPPSSTSRPGDNSAHHQLWESSAFPDHWQELDTNHDGRVDQSEFSRLEVRIRGERLRRVVDR